LPAYFFDSSALAKRYHPEEGSAKVAAIFREPGRRIEVIAKSRSVQRLRSLVKRYGGKNWRKMKGIATIKTLAGSIRWAELHWYEAHGVGRKGWKIKRFLD
jgi:hypothetical protein